MRAATCLVAVAMVTLVAASLFASSTMAKKSTKEWDSMDWKAVEKEWEAGDESPELLSDGQERFRRIQEKSEKMRELPLHEAQKLHASNAGTNHVGKDGIDSRMSAAQHKAATSGRPSMMFVSLNTAKDDGTPWTKADTDDVAGRWKELLSTGGWVLRCGVMRCGVVRCGVMRYGVMRCGAVRCDAVRCDVVRCDAVQCGVVWYDVVRCSAWRCAAPRSNAE